MNSIFITTAPIYPIVVFVGYGLLEEVTPPAGATVTQVTIAL